MFEGPTIRGLATGWPGGLLPAFSTVTVSVSAPDMSTVTAQGSSGTVTLQVPAGSDRLVSVSSVPARGSSAPFFAKAFAGSATVDIEAGETKQVVIKLAVSETSILLPSYLEESEGDLAFSFIDSLTGAPDVLGPIPTELPDIVNFAFDEYGRLFMPLQGDGIIRLSSPEGDETENGPMTTDFVLGELTYDRASARLFYSAYDYEQINMHISFVDSAGEDHGIVAIDGLSVDPYTMIAANDSSLYVSAYDPSIDGYRIMRFAVDQNGYGSPMASITWNALGLADVDHEMLLATGEYEIYGPVVNDMVALNGVLYLAVTQRVMEAQEPPAGCSRGKIIALDASTLARIREIGWCGDENDFPTDPSNQFYGPARFLAVTPRKLYVADDGFRIDPTFDDPYVDVDRLIEIDIDSHAFTGIRSDLGVAFFRTFTYSYDRPTD